jgi:hypothetical protein
MSGGGGTSLLLTSPSILSNRIICKCTVTRAKSSIRKEKESCCTIDQKNIDKYRWQGNRLPQKALICVEYRKEILFPFVRCFFNIVLSSPGVAI